MANQYVCNTILVEQVYTKIQYYININQAQTH